MFLTSISTDLCSLLASVPLFCNLRYFNIKRNHQLLGHARLNLVASAPGSYSQIHLVKTPSPGGSPGPSEVICFFPFLQRWATVDPMFITNHIKMPRQGDFIIFQPTTQMHQELRFPRMHRLLLIGTY